MRINFPQKLLSVLIVCVVFAAAQEPVKPKLNPRIITATRQVQIFLGLEMQLLQNIKKKDVPALQAMVTDELQIEMPDADPTQGEDWIDQVMAKDFTLKSFAIREVSVVELGDSAVVKFERRQEAVYKGKAQSGEFFVVDVWSKAGDTWKLAHRFVSKSNSSAAAAKAPVRPTGKQ
jgi:ketosteroid isomerase-like protein